MRLIAVTMLAKHSDLIGRRSLYSSFNVLYDQPMTMLCLRLTNECVLETFQVPPRTADSDDH
jgi:hypothetical protein